MFNLLTSVEGDYELIGLNILKQKNSLNIIKQDGCSYNKMAVPLSRKMV